jgi:hypothetical protein
MAKRSLRRRRGKGRSKKQRLYNMKGCSKTKSKSQSRNRSRKLVGGYGCGNGSCPIAPFSWREMQQRGGSCAACGSTILGTAQTGGSFYKPATDMPGPFVGQAWSPSISNWPGTDGVSNNRNYLANNLYANGDPQTMMKLGGSKRRKHKGKGLKGGAGLIPQDLVNLGRDASFNLQSAYNALNGYAAPTSPLPYKDQLSSSISANRIII